MIDWDNKYPVRDLGNGKVRAVGMGMAMQGSGISGMDVGSATLKVNDDGFYSLIIGAADMGTGCDTTLAQIAAEVLDCDLDNITVLVQIPTPRPMTPAPTLPLPPMSPARRWRSVPSGCAARSASWVRSCSRRPKMPWILTASSSP